ncbi:hypothetical protein EJC51_26810 [Streptomyces aquilus]|uniref:PASTA domain-containing protein n=1 Tax=Streptomyces aquilus TaxID=2548456 RepID=A0A3Q9C102_9ACTN|nr:hypothetical protein [Streptomyces aquilus]AZP19362.1 hypothetical protein EJC51_26810 [Streptomyces aquilus]
MGFPDISERRIRGFLAGPAAALAILAGVTACGSGTAGEERGKPVAAHEETESPVHPAKGPLDIAMRKTADDRKGFSLRDATGLNRFVSPAHAKKFKVCFEKEKPNLSAVILFAVRNSETCPREVGAEAKADAKADATPNVVGTQLRKAADQLVLAGYAPRHIHVDISGKAVSKERSWSYEVCGQTPAAGTPYSADLRPRLVISASCHQG